MPTAVAPLARQVAERVQKDSGFAEVLDAILEAPTEPRGTLQRVAARSLDEESLNVFNAEWLPLKERDDILTELVLRQRFTVRWPIGGGTWISVPAPA
jgi:hypothetical protein